jgi:hypothetical protein
VSVANDTMLFATFTPPSWLVFNQSEFKPESAYCLGALVTGLSTDSVDNLVLPVRL